MRNDLVEVNVYFQRFRLNHLSDISVRDSDDGVEFYESDD